MQPGVEIDLLVPSRSHGRGFNGRFAFPAVCSRRNGEKGCMKQTAGRVALATLVVIGIVVGVLALWKLKVLIALLFFAFIVAAAMRPSIEWLRRIGSRAEPGSSSTTSPSRGSSRCSCWLARPARSRPGRGCRRRRHPCAARPARRRAGSTTPCWPLDRWLHDLPTAGNVGRPRARRDRARVRDPHRALLRPRVGRVLDLRAQPCDRARRLARCPARSGGSSATRGT